MKKILTILSALALTICVCCGCAKEKVEVNISVPHLIMDCVAYPECKDTRQFIQTAWNEFAAQYDKYDVSLAGGAVQQFEQTAYKENIPDKYGTPEAPDLTFGGYFTLGSYIYDGNVIPLDDIITDKIFYDFSGGTWSQSKATNGKTYMLPFYSLQNVLCYNAELLRSCGVEVESGENNIQGWSLEKWDEVLSTLAQRLPAGSYPMMMYAKTNQGDTHTMVQLRCQGSSFFDFDGDFNLETKEGIAGLQWIKDNYAKGYYPAGCENMEILDCEKLFKDGKLGFYVYNSALASQFKGMDLGYVNFPGKDAHGVNSDWITGFMAFDNGDAKKIEVIKDFLTYIYSSDAIMDYSTGGNPCSKNVTERWHDLLPLDYAFIDNADYSVDFTMNNPNWPEVREAFWPHIHALLTGEESAKDAAAGIDKDCNAAINATERKLHE